MEPHHPEYSGAESSEERERRQKEKERRRLLKALRRWRESRAEARAAEAPAPTVEQAEETDDPDERKAQKLRKVLQLLLLRPGSTPAETAPHPTPETTETAPRFRRLRQVTTQVLARVIDTHDEVRAVISGTPSPELTQDERSLDEAESDLRRASTDFEAALTLNVPETPGADENPASTRPDTLPITLGVPAETRPRQPDATRRSGLPTITKAATASLLGSSFPTFEQPSSPFEDAKTQDNTLRRHEQELGRLRRETVDMQDSVLRHQRVQETVALARQQAEVVDSATQTLQVERPPTPVGEPRFVAPAPLPPMERMAPSAFVAPEVAAPTAPSSYETIPPPREAKFEEHAAVPRPTVEIAAAAPSKEAPTEQQMSDRVERDPGNNWTAPAANNTATQVHDTSLPSWQVASSTVPPRIVPDEIRKAHHNPQPTWPHQGRGWLLVAVFVIIVVGLLLLSWTV